VNKQERLLSILRSRPGHFYSHGEIHDRLWPGWRNDKHLDKASMGGTLKVLVYNLRREGYRIESKHGVG
jgi:DNA-binding winged helix-turn-helix (wHTH) protein